jgi:hypothetical protein
MKFIVEVGGWKKHGERSQILVPRNNNNSRLSRRFRRKTDGKSLFPKGRDSHLEETRPFGYIQSNDFI